jgi:hypothetical protein
VRKPSASADVLTTRRKELCMAVEPKRDDGDEHDGAAHTIVLVAVAGGGPVLGGVRVHPEGPDGGLGWWRLGPARRMAA